MKTSEALGFFFRYLRNPASIGAVCPSSRFLARKIAAQYKNSVDENGVIAELGSGTGAVTKYLLSDLPIKPENLFCVEFDRVSAEILRSKFPRVNVANDSAENIAAILGEKSARLKCVVSCLPLLSLPEECAAAILKNVEDVLPKGGLFSQFTYNLASSPAAKYFSKMRPLKTVFALANVPPARVDVFEKI